MIHLFRENLKIFTTQIPHLLLGINPTIDHARNSFPLLAKAIEALRPVVDENLTDFLHLNHTSLDKLLECVYTADKYFKNHFSYNLGETSNVASHCIQCAVACGKKPAWFGRGCGQAHTDTCEFCQLVPDIVRYVLSLFGSHKHFFSHSQPFRPFLPLFGVPRTIVAPVMPILVHFATQSKEIVERSHGETLYVLKPK